MIARILDLTMKTIAILLLLVGLSTIASAQQQYDVTVRDSSRLQPGASKKQQADWMEAQMLERMFPTAGQPQTSTQGGGLTPAQIQVTKLFCVRAMVLEQLLVENPQLKARADQLNVEYEQKITQSMLSGKW